MFLPARPCHTPTHTRRSTSVLLTGLLTLILALALSIGGQRTAAAAAHPYTLTGSGSKTIMAGTSAKLTATYHHDGKPVASATIVLERKKGSSWVHVANVKITKGKGTATVKPAATTTYRFRKPAVVKSSTTKITVKPPSSFTIAGSGNGHGVGMSQYGAYEMALSGKTAKQILSLYYPGTKLGESTNPSRLIDVQVFGPGSDTATSTTIKINPTKSGTKPTWKLVNAASGTTMKSGSGTISMKVAVASSKPKVTIGSTSYTAAKLEVQWSGTRVDSPSGVAAYASITGAHGSYRNGQLILTAIKGKSQPNIVNEVLLNTEYLYGLDEMPSSWGKSGSGKGLQALEAQAIVARGYAVQTILKNPSAACNCNLYDDTRSQNYTGWVKQNGADGSTWTKAVKATTLTGGDQILTYGGSTSFADPTYFAATGASARTAANQQVFGSAGLGYLQGVKDPYTAKAPGLPASDKAWTHSVSQATMVKIFGLSTVKSVTITAKYASGQVKTLKATSDTGATKSVTEIGDYWRSALGLRADWLSKLTPHA